MKWEDKISLSEQTAGITSVSVEKDIIVCLPTGYGKSIDIYHIHLKSSLWCHLLHSERTRAKKSAEFTRTIDRITSATAVCTLDFICFKEGPPSCTICGRVILRCELIAIRARPSSALSARRACVWGRAS